jgi:hypothetical protein
VRKDKEKRMKDEAKAAEKARKADVRKGKKQSEKSCGENIQELTWK